MFLLYTVDNESNYELVSRIKIDKKGKGKAHSDVHLAGKDNSPLRSYVINNKDKTNKVKKLNNGCLIWEMNEEDLIEGYRKTRKWESKLNGIEAALFIDLKPNDKEKKVSLYKVVKVYGYTYKKWWTVIMVKMEPFFIDFDPAIYEPSKTVEDLKRGFNKEYLNRFRDNRLKGKDGLRKEGFVYEFLYLNHEDGFNKSNWSWGSTGSVNAALLFEGEQEALSYFLRILNEETGK
jgi:hypothetical protein